MELSLMLFGGFFSFLVLIIIAVSFFVMRETPYEEAVVDQRVKEQGIDLQIKHEKSSKEKKKKKSNIKKSKPEKVEEKKINVPASKIKKSTPVSKLPLAEVKPISVTKPIVQQKNAKNINNKPTEGVQIMKSNVESKKVLKKEVNESAKGKSSKKGEMKPVKAEVKPLVKPLKTENKPAKNESKPVKNEAKVTNTDIKQVKAPAKSGKAESNKQTKAETKSQVANSKTDKADSKQKNEGGNKSEGKTGKSENKSETNASKKSEGKDSTQKNNNDRKNNSAKNDDNGKKDDIAPTPASPTKRPKKLKYDMGSGDNGMNGIHLATILRNAILTDAELQTLIEILLNRQQEGESWVKMGQKIDPLSALKKQLQETEQKLADEQQTSLTTSNKLKEVRQELTKAVQLERVAREKFVAQQQDYQNLQLHFHNHREQHASDNNASQIKIQQIQVKNEEQRITLQHLQDENESLKQALAQLEANSKSVTSNEIARLQCDVDQWRLACEHHKEQLAANQQADSERQQHIHQLQQCIQDLKKAEKKTQQEMNDLLKQLSQSDSNRAALQRDLGLYQNIQAENNSLHNTIRDLEKTNNNFCQRVKELEDQIHGTESKLKGCIKDNEVKQQEAQHDLEQLCQANEMMKMKLEETMNDIVGKESLLAKQENDLAQYLDEVQQLTKELTAQREQNNDLRRKNWKAMEALSKTEKMAEDKVKMMEKVVGEVSRVLSKLIPGCNYSANDDFNDWLEKTVEKIVEDYSSVASLKEELARLKETSQETEKNLNSNLKQIQDVLHDREAKLHALQRRFEDEELVWKEKLSYTENDLKQNEKRVEDLHGKLLIEENERKLADLKASEASKTMQGLQQAVDEMSKKSMKYQDIETSLNKKVQELEEQLELQKKSVKELTSQAVKLKGLVRIGEDSLKAEQEVVRELQKKIAEQKTLTATSNGTSSNDGIEETVN